MKLCYNTIFVDENLKLVGHRYFISLAKPHYDFTRVWLQCNLGNDLPHTHVKRMLGTSKDVIVLGFLFGSHFLFSEMLKFPLAVHIVHQKSLSYFCKYLYWRKSKQ